MIEKEKIPENEFDKTMSLYLATKDDVDVKVLSNEKANQMKLMDAPECLLYLKGDVFKVTDGQVQDEIVGNMVVKFDDYSSTASIITTFSVSR